MTTLYRPVLIETAEQAEALPKGTVAVLTVDDGTALAAPKRSAGANGFWWDEGGSVGDEHMIGWSALVPIEAEEEFGAGGDGVDEDFYLTRRLVTPWEEVAS